MSSVAEQLHKWAVEELSLVSEGAVSKIPDVETLRQLTKGKNSKKMWTYVINHVRSQATVDKVKRTLMLKKMLTEREENPKLTDDLSSDIEKLKAAISRAYEKREYLMRTLSTLEERILVLEQEIAQIKNKRRNIYKKTALLEQLKQLHEEKKVLSKRLSEQISSYQRLFQQYQATKAHENFALPNYSVYNESTSKIKHIIEIGSSVIEGKFFEDKIDIGTLQQNYKNSYYEFTKSGILLKDFVILLKEMTSTDLQQIRAINMENSSFKEFILGRSKEHPANVLLNNLKCESIYYAISARKPKQEIKKVFTTKEEYFNDKMNKVGLNSDDVDYEDKCALLEVLAENEALKVSIKHLESNLKEITDKTSVVQNNVHQNRLCAQDLTPLVQHFHKKVDMTLFLLYSTPDTIREILDVLSSLQTFAENDFFKLPFPLEGCLEKLKFSFSTDKKLTWDYFAKSQLSDPIFTESLEIDSLPSDVGKFLRLEPYQNISVLCEKWMQLKQKLRAKIAAEAKIHGSNDNINVSLSYSNIMEFLKKMKFSVEKGMRCINEGMIFCRKVDERIEEWWDQSAQFIPQIEYEGKTLKMWLDILTVLSDFEPPNYGSN